MKYLKTEAGQQAFKARSPLLSARQRSAFILFDGLKTTGQVLAATAGLGITPDDIEHLLQQGFLAPLPDAVAIVPAPASAIDEAGETTAAPVSGRTPQERYRDAMPIATALTAGLGLRGFRLNLAVEGASGFDDLLALLPKIQDAVGVPACVALERALKA